MPSIPPPPPSPPRPYQAAMDPEYHMGGPPPPPPPPPHPHPHDAGFGQGYGQHIPSPESFFAEPRDPRFDPHSQYFHPNFVELAPPPPTFKNGKAVAIYAGYVFTIIDPSPGESRTWTRAQLLRIDKDQSALSAMVKKDIGKGNKVKEIFASKDMNGAKRSQIEHLLYDHQTLEIDPRLEWMPAMIKLEKVKGKEQATKSMQVIIKRVSKTPVVHVGRRDSAGKFNGGVISDLNARQFHDRPTFNGHHDPIINVGSGHGQYHQGQHPPDQRAYPVNMPGEQHVHMGNMPMDGPHDPMHLPRESKYPAREPSRQMPSTCEPMNLGPMDGGFDGHFDEPYGLDNNHGGKKDKNDKKDKKDKRDKHKPAVHQTSRQKVHPYPTSASDSEPDSLFSLSENEQEHALYTPDSSICGENKGRRRSSYYGNNKDPRRHAHESSKHQRSASHNLDGDPYVVVGKGPPLRRHDSATTRPTNYRRESHLDAEEIDWRRRREEREREEREAERKLARIEGKLEAMRMVESQERGRDRPLTDRPFNRERDREYPFEGGRKDRHRDGAFPPRGTFGREHGRAYGREYDYDYDDRDRGYGGYSRR